MIKVFHKFCFATFTLFLIQCQFLGGDAPGDAIQVLGKSDVHTVDLYVPLLQTSAEKVSKVRTVGLDLVEEDGIQVRYVVRSQTFPSWNDSLEQLWNIFALESFLIFRAQLRAADKDGSTKELYADIPDPFTSYIDKDSAEAFLSLLFTTSSPGAVGVRTQLVETGDTVQIIQVAPNSPASQAGMRKRDLVLEVNGVSTIGDSAVTLFNREIQGDSGTALSFVLYDGDTTRSVSLVKDIVNFPSVLVDTVDGNGMISVFSFTTNTYDGKSTADEFIEALEETSDRDVTILDLRSNPGGSVGVVLNMCDAILSSGVIIREEGRGLFPDSIPRSYSNVHRATASTTVAEGRKFILLGNSRSASASEILISALMEGLNVALVGDTTYGKGVGQVVFTTPDGGVAKITSLQFLSREGNSYNGSGIYPTYPVPAGETLSRALELSREMRSLPLSKKGRYSGVNGREILSEGISLPEPMAYW